MEDDDGSSSIRSLQINISSLLYCHEDPLLVSTPPPPPAVVAAADDDDSTTTSSSNCVLPHQPAAASSVATNKEMGVVDEEAQQAELHELLVEHMGRQGCYAPSRGYLEHLLQEQQQQQQGVAAARSRGVHYIIYALGRLGLLASTAFNAVNYLDRFLSINCHLRWEAWMVELVSVACLSIACKLDEVNVPSLHHLQMEEVMSHSFRAATVRDMELTLLKALQWRLACVTPYSFLQLLILPLLTRATTSSVIAAAAASRCTRLLIRSLAEPSLVLRFDSSMIAASALRCVALQQEQQDHHHHLQANNVGVSSSDIISRLLMRHSDCQTEQDKADADECLKMMQELYASCLLDLKYSHHHQYLYSEQQWSPVSAVIPFQTHGGNNNTTTVNRSAVSRRLFGGSTPQGSTQDDLR